MKSRGLTVAILLILLPLTAYSGEDKILYARGRHFVKTHQMDFAYMQFRDIVRQYPQSTFREDALFATGEYFVQNSNFKEATKIFEEFIKEYPTAKTKIFALAYLYKMAKEKNDADLVERIKTDIITIERLGFVFRDSKEYKYHSLFHWQYHVLLQIDKITISCNGDRLAEISY